MSAVDSPEKILFASTTQAFLLKEAPLRYVRELHAAGLSFDPAWWRRAAELGWTGLLVPEDLGGGSVSGSGITDLVMVAEQLGKTVAPGPLRLAACPAVYTGDPGSRAAQWACNQIGKSYVFGADGPNTFDCSGLTMRAWGSVGVSLPHNAYQQKHSIAAVSFQNLKPGDLVFYFAGISHVTIYVGKGYVVSAPQTGDVVRMKRYNEITPVGYGRP